MKKHISLIAGLLCLVIFAACGRGYVPMPPVEETANATMAKIEAETESETTEPELETTEAATESAATQTSATTTTAPTAKTSATTVMQRTVAITASKASSTSTAARTSTSRAPTTTAASPAPTATPTNPPAPVYTQADYEAIIAEVRAYAESKTNARFVWDPSLTREKADAGLAGYHGMPNLTRHSKQSVLADLKYHVDLTAEHVARNARGMEPIVNYHVYWYSDAQGTWGFGPNDVCFILIYG